MQGCEPPGCEVVLDNSIEHKVPCSFQEQSSLWGRGGMRCTAEGAEPWRGAGARGAQAGVKPGAHGAGGVESSGGRYRIRQGAVRLHADLAKSHQANGESRARLPREGSHDGWQWPRQPQLHCHLSRVNIRCRARGCGFEKGTHCPMQWPGQSADFNSMENIRPIQKGKHSIFFF